MKIASLREERDALLAKVLKQLVSKVRALVLTEV